MQLAFIEQHPATIVVNCSLLIKFHRNITIFQPVWAVEETHHKFDADCAQLKRDPRANHQVAESSREPRVSWRNCLLPNLDLMLKSE